VTDIKSRDFPNEKEQYWVKKGPLSINGVFDSKWAKNGIYTEGSLFLISI
jgi:hypothetical protein